jgi:prevent-host-death family protein
MTTRVPVARARQELADLLARVSRGDRVEITRFGVPRAILLPVQKHRTIGRLPTTLHRRRAVSVSPGRNVDDE